jgi:peptide/nickel transport system permease protein
MAVMRRRSTVAAPSARRSLKPSFLLVDRVMAGFLCRRLGQALLVLWAISALVFVMLYRVGDPLATLLPPEATEAQRSAMRRELGLDGSLGAQYARYMARLLRGDLGRSYYSGRPIAEELAERAPATLELATAALLLAALTGIPLGAWAGARPRSAASRLAMGASLAGVSIPSFWLGLILMMTFGVWLGWLPVSGRGATIHALGANWSFPTLDGLRHLILPAATLAAYPMAMLLRLTRAEMAKTLASPFIRVARARGLSEAAVIGRHAMRNALAPLVTVLGLQLGGLLAFSVVTETIFQWPGLGKLLIDRIAVDRPLVVAYLLLAGAVFILLNAVVDLLYALIDPRIRLGSDEKRG